MRIKRFLLFNILTFILSSAVFADVKENYRSYCAVCHGVNLEGAMGSPLNTGRFKHASSEKDLINVIRYGVISRGMPGFKHLLKDEDIVQLVALIKESTVLEAQVAKADISVSSVP